MQVLYVVYWGATEPLGRSLVVPTVAGLAELGVKLTVLTYEKPDDAAGEAAAFIGRELAHRDIQWRPLRYHKGPGLPAKLYDIARGVVAGLAARRARPFDLVHARTFVGGIIGAAVACLVRVPLIYHAEGSYAEEQVDARVWQRGSLRHRLASGLEKRLYAMADGVLVLSSGAKREVEGALGLPRRAIPVIALGSRIDVARFPAPPTTPRALGTLRLVYAGSIGGRYDFDAVVRFAVAARREFGDLDLKVLTHSAPASAEAALRQAGLPEEGWSVRKARYEEMPAELSWGDAGVHFLKPGTSAAGGSPTKVGEYWAAGLPVVASGSLGDADAVIRRDRVGIVLDEDSPSAYGEAAQALRRLLADPRLRLRCRSAADSLYGLEEGCRRQLDLYESVVGQR